MYKVAIAAIVFLCSFTMIDTGNNTNIEDALRAFVKNKECTKINLSGNLLSFSSKSGHESNVDVFQLYIFDEENPLSKNEINQVTGIAKKHNLEILNQIRNKDSRIEIYIKDSDDYIEELYMTVFDSDRSGVIFHAEGKIHYDDLENLNIDFDGSDVLKKHSNKK